MAKIKVHELAKEVGADRKAVVEYLRAKGYETITAVSLVPDGEVENVRSRFGPGKTGGASDFSGAFAVKKEGAAAEEGQKKKSKHIVGGHDGTGQRLIHMKCIGQDQRDDIVVHLPECADGKKGKTDSYGTAIIEFHKLFSP